MMYCSQSSIRRLIILQKVFLADALRMRYLFNVYRQISIMKERPEDSDCEYTPHTITLQLKSLIIKEIAQLEFKILSEIDELIRGSKTTDNANALAVWVCLWIVILSYRDNLSLQRACILCLGDSTSGTVKNKWTDKYKIQQIGRIPPRDTTSLDISLMLSHLHMQLFTRLPLH
jgi:dolichol kinase